VGANLPIFEKFVKVFERLPFSIPESTYHIVASYLLNRKLDKYEHEGRISKFKAQIEKIKKRRYRIEVELYLSEEQAKNEFSNILKKLPFLKGGD